MSVGICDIIIIARKGGGSARPLKITARVFFSFFGIPPPSLAASGGAACPAPLCGHLLNFCVRAAWVRGGFCVSVEVTYMPYKPKKPCKYPGCPRLTDGNYCELHKPIMSKRYETYSRDSGHSKNYGAKWRKIRKAYVQAHPLCERCLQRKIYTKTQDVHHVRPIRDGGTNDCDNLMALCRKCHAEIHAELGTRSHNKTVYDMDGGHSKKRGEGGQNP